MIELETQNAELIEQINSLQAAYGRMADEHFEEKKELKAQLAKANERVAEVEDSNKRMLHEVANQYDGDDSTEWSIGANHVFRLFAKWVHKNEQLRKEQGE